LEVLFGLIVVITVTGALSVAAAVPVGVGMGVFGAALAGLTIALGG
jgi:hypothetical protein